MDGSWIFLSSDQWRWIVGFMGVSGAVVVFDELMAMRFFQICYFVFLLWLRWLLVLLWLCMIFQICLRVFLIGSCLSPLMIVAAVDCFESLLWIADVDVLSLCCCADDSLFCPHLMIVDHRRLLVVIFDGLH
ncbi:hypothetical protein Droror1_Dr00027605 [Drosera rotundifolia]